MQMNCKQLPNSDSPQEACSVPSNEFCSVVTPSHEEDEEQEDHRPSSKRPCTEYLRIPCRARSLSDDHNNETAYFEIPRDAPHGLQLHCSHEECIRSGRRFRYCQVCKLPVAKRNFFKRHSHGMVKSSKELRHTIDLLHPCKIKGQKASEKSDETLTTILDRNVEMNTSEHISDISSSEAEEESDDSETGKNVQGQSERQDPCFENNTTIPSGKHLSSKAMSGGMDMIHSSHATHLNNFVPCTVVAPVYVPVPNPLKASLSESLPHVIPASPITQPCPLEIIFMEEFMDLIQSDTISVPLVEPGRKITQDAFAKAIDGIDFSRVFD